MTPDDLEAIRGWVPYLTDIEDLREYATDLLTEVDRLTEDRDYWENLAEVALPYPESDVLRDRESIRAAVEALEVDSDAGAWAWWLRAAVLGIIDGGEQ